MGKVEKVIVLSVLFLIALILVVSLTVDDPLDKSRVVEAGTSPKNPIVSPSPAPNPGLGTNPLDPKGDLAVAGNSAISNTSSSPLLSMPIQAGGNGTAPIDPAPNNPAPQPIGIDTGSMPPAAPAGLPAGALLKKLDGLQDSILPDMKLYTWQPNDNYRRIAFNYYGDWTKFTVLRRSNEGRNDVQPGEQIFVPVFDSDATVAAVPPPPAAPSKAIKGTDKGNDKASKKSGTKSVVANPPKGTGNKTHVVKSGESLWKIAHAELGDGGRWHEIFDMNKDVLPTEKSLRPGLTLRLP